jgi:hypothetical protein
LLLGFLLTTARWISKPLDYDELAGWT